MIRLQSIAISEFRGIRNLTIDFRGENFGICGRNGTGKSGVVDAIEFALTGSITRLTGQGTSGISLRAHGPHVDSRTKPENARVKLTVQIPALNKTATIARTVGSSTRPVITPRDADVLTVFRRLSSHPEFALSRREILKYVLIAPGERAKEVQALLRLDELERVRASLQRVANDCAKDVNRATEEVDVATPRLKEALGIADLKSEAILRAVNERRAVLGLAPLLALDRHTMLGEGVTVAAPGSPRLIKATLLQDLLVVDEGDSPEDAPTAARNTLRDLLQKLHAQPALLKNLRHRVFLQTGVDLIDEALCPFCDREWSEDALRTHVAAKLAEANEAATVTNSIEAQLPALRRDVRNQAESLERLIAAAPVLLASPVDALISFSDAVSARLTDLVSTQGVIDRPDAINSVSRLLSVAAKQELASLKGAVSALPDASKEDRARNYLVLAQERLENWRQSKRRHAEATARASLTSKIFEAYNWASTEVLGNLYKTVAGDFSTYYRFINSEDEAAFQGQLKPSFGKLALDVDFYKRGPFPPGAYHSEGHQDAMGLCLYLALMKHTLGNDFTFAVLDDVLMSVDVGHRKAVCKLLATVFPKTQFIFTTHDRVWLEHMISEQMIARKGSIEFRDWTVDEGPFVWSGADVWKEIDDAVRVSDIPGASSKLRRYLEYSMSVLAERLRAKVEYRADGQADLGMLLPAVIGDWNALLRKGKDAAAAGNHKDRLTALTEREESFKAAVVRCRLENWALNRTIHYNPWATLDRADFTPVVAAFRALLAELECKRCSGRPYVLPAHGESAGTLRCECGDLLVTLNKSKVVASPSQEAVTGERQPPIAV